MEKRNFHGKKTTRWTNLSINERINESEVRN